MTGEFLQRVFPRNVHHVAGLHEAIRGSCRKRAAFSISAAASTPTWKPIARRNAKSGVPTSRPIPELRHADWFRMLRKGGQVPFPDGHFDLVVAVMVLEHVADPRAFLGEVARILSRAATSSATPSVALTM